MKKFLISCLLCVPLIASALTAKSYAVVDIEGNVLASKNADVPRPIASITKLITAERNADLPPDELITITEEDIRRGRMRSSPLRAGEAYPRSLLQALSLVNSDNVAAIALGRTANTTVDLPLNTTYVEASGLDPNNRSTALELAQIARELYNTDIAATSVQPSVMVGDRVRKSTNPLLNARGWEFFLSKTGFINASGGCLVVITKIKEKLVAVAILGSANTRERWRDLAELRAQLGDRDFQWPGKTKTKAKVIKRKKR